MVQANAVIAMCLGVGVVSLSVAIKGRLGVVSFLLQRELEPEDLWPGSFAQRAKQDHKKFSRFAFIRVRTRSGTHWRSSALCGLYLQKQGKHRAKKLSAISEKQL